MIDIEEELKMAQIKYVQKELEQLRHYYSDITDIEFLHIFCSYEEMLELAVSTDDRLLLYKKMYQDSLNYLFKESEYTSLEADYLCKDSNNIEYGRKTIVFYFKFLQLYITERHLL
ncbi:MAG: hypothetical protein ACERKN_07760 [Velocimicrobium sp.]